MLVRAFYIVGDTKSTNKESERLINIISLINDCGGHMRGNQINQ